ncbi:uncharacterized protein LOC113680374, partial [Pocillopora damicornis]|uniref:uncharacterized protein LOC113680374 n=1 Tax=Pocillopora damicornis TaxID=46731 RepID=UPI000F54CA1B
MIDEHVSSLTITLVEIQETERLTRGQAKNNLWFEKRRTVLTASNFGNAAKTRVEPSNKLKAGMTVDEACKEKNFCLEKLADGSVQLKRNHNYFCQVQGQLYCSIIPLEGIIFVVYFGENMPLFIEKIHFQNSKWYDELLPKIDY